MRSEIWREFLNVLFSQINHFLAAVTFKDALSGRRQFSAAESPLKTMKNAFYFTLKALFILEIFKFLS